MKLNQSDRNPLYVFKTHKPNSEKSEKGSSNILSNAAFDALSVYNSKLSIETNQHNSWIVHKNRRTGNSYKTLQN